MAWEVKLVPNDDPDADGRWMRINPPTEPRCGDVIGIEHVVKVHVYQPFTMSGDTGWWL